jgi:hypothetical protein
MNTTTTAFGPRRVLQLITALVIGLSAVVAVAAPAHAFVEPIDPTSDVLPASNDVPAGLTSGASLATIAATVVITLLVVAAVVMARRASSHRRDAEPASLDAQPAGLHV